MASSNVRPGPRHGRANLVCGPAECVFRRGETAMFTNRAVDIAVDQLTRPILDRSEGLQTALGQLWQRVKHAENTRTIRQIKVIRPPAAAPRRPTCSLHWFSPVRIAHRARKPLCCFTTSWVGGVQGLQLGPAAARSAQLDHSCRPHFQDPPPGPFRRPNLAVLGPHQGPFWPQDRLSAGSSSGQVRLHWLRSQT